MWDDNDKLLVGGDEEPLFLRLFNGALSTAHICNVEWEISEWLVTVVWESCERKWALPILNY
jgi:hypothetical protein